MPLFQSSAVIRAEYDTESGVLQLWFAESGGPYDYVGVPRSVFDGLLAASSKGRFFNQQIRDRYSVSRVSA
jgi:hypothetical protein